MRSTLIVIGAAQVALVLGAILLLRSGQIPLGVPGEWEWLRVKLGPDLLPMLFGILAVAGYAVFVGLGSSQLSKADTGRSREARWLVGLFVCAVVVQALVQEAAPTGHGLSKWALALINPGSSGYYTVAKTKIADPARFLGEYPAWIKTQGSLHIGTHPPGLFLEAYAALRLMESNPELSKWVMEHAPASVELAFKTLGETVAIPRADRASMTLTGALTLLCCAATVIPLYLLARARLGPAPAWATAALWPLVPAAILFQPSADTGFSILSVSALLCSAWASKAWPWALAAGVLLALGMQFSLAFLAVGLIVGIAIWADLEQSWKLRLVRFLATGVGFLAATIGFWAISRANPFAIWWANQANHAGFYVEFPRSYLPWLMETPIEVAIAIGFPAAVWICLGLRSAQREAIATAAVLLVLLVTGRSLSEVARLWIPFFPMLLLAAGAGFKRTQAGRISLALAVGLMGLEVLGLQAMIQVVYPV